MTAIDPVGAVKVWILPAEPLPGQDDGRIGYNYKWNSFFVECKRLIPVGESVRLPGGGGSAGFRLLRQVREENGVTTSGDDNVVIGSYVAISLGNSTNAFNFESCVWFGWISSITFENAVGSQDQLGSVSALGIGALLDGMQIFGWKRVNESTTGSSASIPIGFPIDLPVPPTANMSTVDGEIIGNAKHMQSGQAPNLLLDSHIFGFATNVEDCGVGITRIWTRWRLLLHVLYFCVPPAFPNIVFDVTQEQINTLDDFDDIEVWDLRGLTLKGALDMLLPRARGLGWDIVPQDGASWLLTFYSYDFDKKFTNRSGPVNDANAPKDIDITSLQVKALTFTEGAGDVYEEIVLRGSPIVSCATYSFEDSNLAKGWTTAQETAFRYGAQGGSGYGSLSEERQKERNRALRSGPYLCDVFSRFVFNSLNNDGMVTVKEIPVTGSTFQAAVPTIAWNGQAVYAYTPFEEARFPYLPTARIQRTIPWPIGVQSDGTDTRDDAAKARPAYMEPRLFRYTLSGYGEDDHWVDLLADGGESEPKERGRPHVASDDRGGGVVIKYSPPEMLAKASWTDGTDGVSDIIPDNDPKDRAIDYNDLVMTLAVESDQYLQVVKRRPGISDGANGDFFVRRRLTIDVPELKCWVVVKGTILGVKNDGTPDMVVVSDTGANNLQPDESGTCFLIRNDYAIAEKMASMAAAWAFENRRSMGLTFAMSDAVPSWVRIGQMIGKVQDTQSTICNTVIEELRYNWSLQSPSIGVSTTIPPMPEFRRGGVSSSPSNGGQISVALGGTVSQAVNQVRAEILDIKRDTQKIPIITSRGGSFSAPTQVTLRILDGQTIYNAGGTTYYGVNRSGTLIATVPTLYDPNSVGGTAGLFTAATGIGRCQVYFNEVLQPGYFLCVHDTRSGFSYSVIQNDPIVAGSLVSIPDIAATGFIQAYTFSFP